MRLLTLTLLATLPSLLAASAPPSLSVGLGIGLPTGIRRDFESRPGLRDGFNLRPRFMPSLAVQWQLAPAHGVRVRQELVWASPERHRFEGVQVDRSLWGTRTTAEYVFHPGKQDTGLNLFLGAGAQGMWARSQGAGTTATRRTLSAVVTGGFGWDLAPGTGLALRTSYGRFEGQWFPRWNGTSRELTTSLEARLRVF